MPNAVKSSAHTTLERLSGQRLRGIRLCGIRLCGIRLGGVRLGMLLWVVLVGQVAGQEGLLGGLPTLGGPISWTDQIIHGEWRIQKHAVLGHCRLLSPKERRITAGTLEACFQALEQRRAQGQIAPMSGHVVILLHGLGGTREFIGGLGDYLHEAGGFTVINFGYASTKGTVQELAVALESVVRNLQGVHEISFVGHSMGNILVRHMLFRFQVQGNPPPVEFRRMVMISPPNHGANLADTIGQSRLVQLALGDVVDQFAPNKGWTYLERQLATPHFEFGIIAGGRGNDRGYLPRVPGDDDGLISLQTHMLDGASDFIRVGGLHQLMPRYPKTKKATLKFLQCGHF